MNRFYDTISQRDKILLAAQELEEETCAPLGLEALIVFAWQKFPTTFGLKGFADLYPDSNKIVACLVGQRGIVAQGDLRQEGPRRYAVTAQGRQRAYHLAEGDPVRTPGRRGPVQVPPRMARFLTRTLDCVAFDKFIQGLGREVSLSEACILWDTAGRGSGEALDEFDFALSFLKERLADGDCLLPSGRQVAAEEVARLAQFHEQLRARFAVHLKCAGSRRLEGAAT